MSSIVNVTKTTGVTPKYMLVDADGKVVKTGELSISTGSAVTTDINYTVTKPLTLYVGGVAGSMNYKTGAGNFAGSSGNMNYCEFVGVGGTIEVTTTTTQITFEMTVNVLV